MQLHADLSNPVHAHYLAVLPDLRRYAKSRLQHGDRNLREEELAEALAAGYVNCHSLVTRGRSEHVHTTGFAAHAVHAVRNGRQVGSSMASRDVMSARGKFRHKRHVQRLDSPAEDSVSHRDEVPLSIADTLADTRTPVPDQAAFRIDFAEWFSTQCPRDQMMIEMLAAGEQACVVAKKLGVSPAMISLRRERWRASWRI